MTEQDPDPSSGGQPSGSVPPRPIRAFPDLGVRVVSAVVLVTIALVDFWQGGIWVTLLVTLGTCLMIWELRRMLTPTLSLKDPALWCAVVAGGACVMMTGLHTFWSGLILLPAAVVPVLLVRRGHTAWMAAGIVYISVAMALLVQMRAHPEFGFPLVLWLVSVVIAADVGAYFAGRTIGGPKLWPSVSPNKTWAGAIGGLVSALIVGVGFYFGGHVTLPWLIMLSVILALASQAGDLLESWIKRRFGVKDSSSIIPGHGGLLDRFDGLMGALWAYLLLSFTSFVSI
ncbi:phosphatidate cytidylyltransferase [Halovulum sp. GXIMD14794]